MFWKNDNSKALKKVKWVLKSSLIIISILGLLLCCYDAYAENTATKISTPVASNTGLKPNSATTTPAPVQKPTLYKRNIVIEDRTIIFIGGTTQLEVVERQLYIQSKIKDVINKFLNNKQYDIKVDIDFSTYQFLINDIPIDKVTDVDALVNKTSKRTLLKVWQFNIIDLIKYYKKHKIYKEAPLVLRDTIIIFIIFLVIIVLIEFLLPKINRYIHYFVIKSVKASEERKRKLELEELAEEDREYIPKIEETPKIKKKKLEQTEDLARHTCLIFNIFVRILQFNLLIIPILFALYLYPGTYPYVNAFVNHFMGVIIVTSETISQSLFDNKTWECAGNALIVLVYTILFILTIKILSSIAQNIIYLKFSKQRSREKRFHTINIIISTTLQLIVIAISIVNILEVFNINPIPILTSAGLVGVALSIGAQNLIKDVVNGFFILIENQFGLGDYIKTDSLEGYVDDMTLRITVLRDKTGIAHIVPNSQINKVSVYTKDWARATVYVTVAYDTDIDTAIEIIQKASKALKDDMPSKVIGEIKVLGVEDIVPANMIIKVQMEVTGGEQWHIERELRRRIKYALDQNSILPK